MCLPAGLLESSMRLKPHEAQSYRKKALWVSWISIVVTLILAIAAFGKHFVFLQPMCEKVQLNAAGKRMTVGHSRSSLISRFPVDSEKRLTSNPDVVSKPLDALKMCWRSCGMIKIRWLIF